MSGPILESQSVHVIFQKKGKIFGNLWKTYKIGKYFEKGQPHACDYRMHKTARICHLLVFEHGFVQIRFRSFEFFTQYLFY